MEQVRTPVNGRQPSRFKGEEVPCVICRLLRNRWAGEMREIAVCPVASPEAPGNCCRLLMEPAWPCRVCVSPYGVQGKDNKAKDLADAADPHLSRITGPGWVLACGLLLWQWYPLGNTFIPAFWSWERKKQSIGEGTGSKEQEKGERKGHPEGPITASVAGQPIAFIGGTYKDISRSVL